MRSFVFCEFRRLTAWRRFTAAVMAAVVCAGVLSLVPSPVVASTVTPGTIQYVGGGSNSGGIFYGSAMADLTPGIQYGDLFVVWATSTWAEPGTNGLELVANGKLPNGQLWYFYKAIWRGGSATIASNGPAAVVWSVYRNAGYNSYAVSSSPTVDARATNYRAVMATAYQDSGGTAVTWEKPVTNRHAAASYYYGRAAGDTVDQGALSASGAGSWASIDIDLSGTPPLPAEPKYVDPAPLRTEQAFGVSCDGGRAAVENTQSAGDPVNTATGGLTETFLDVSVPGPGREMRWGRAYNSLDESPGPFGRGWTFEHNASLTRAPDGVVTFRDGTGGQSRFAPNADGVGYAAADAAVTAQLSDRPEGGWVLRSQACNDFVFDTAGRLVEERDREGRAVVLSYDADGRLAKLRDPAGQELTLSWGTSGAEAGLITAVTTSDGRAVGYGYETAANESRLTSVIAVDGRVTRYGYDDATGLLSGITDPAGNTSAINTYDPVTRRVVRQVDAEGSVMTFEWDPATETATVTDGAGRTRRDVYSGNNLVRQIDGGGNVSEVRYSANSMIAAVDDPLGRRDVIWRDARGNMIRRAAPAPLSTLEEWTYDAANRVSSYRDGRGHLLSYDYDPQGRVSKLSYPNGTATTYTYTASGQVETVTAPGGRVTRHGYNSVGDLVSVTSPSGATTTMTYDSAHRMLTRIDPRGNVPGADPAGFTTSWTYDKAGRVLSQTDPLGHTVTHTYDPAGNRKSTTDAAGKTTTFTYNGRHQLLTWTDPLGRVSTYGYDTTGLLSSVTDPAGGKTSFGYDNRAQLVTRTAPAGNVPGADAETIRRHTTRYVYDTAGQLVETRQVDPANPAADLVTKTGYDALGRVSTVTDPARRTTGTEYDNSGNLAATIAADGGRTETAHDELGRPRTVTDPQGRVTAYDYDPATGDLRAVTKPGNRVTTFTHDPDARIRSIVDARGNVAGADPVAFTTTIGYDPAGNTTTVTDPLGRTVTTAWDAANQRRSITDAQGRVTTWGYHPTGALASVTAPTGAVTSYRYDDAGQLDTRVEPGGRTSTFTYRPDGLLESATTAAGQKTSYRYDTNGNPTTVVRPSGNATPEDGDGTITTSFDWLGRATKLDYSDTTPDVALAYDRSGLVTTATQAMPGGAVATSYGYDPAGRTASITRGGEKATYTYNKAGQLTSRGYADGRSFTYRYGTDGLLASLTPATGGTTGAATTYSWDPSGRLAATTRPGGITSTYAHDPAGQLTRLTHANGTTTLVDHAITWNASGEPTQVTSTEAGATKATLYSYADAQLTAVCRPDSGTECKPRSPSTTYTYDELGRRTTETPKNIAGAKTLTYTYNSADQLTTVTNPSGGVVESATWDPDGNQTSRTSSKKTTRFTYGLDDNLASAALPDRRNLAYTYDTDGNRLTRTINGAPDKTWTWDRLSADLGIRIGETSSSGATAHAWTPDPVSGLATAAADTAGTEPTWLLDDPFGNLTHTATTTGGITGSVGLNPFGDQAGAPTDAAEDNPLRFHGQYLDELTGLYDIRARDYNPNRAGFTAIDPAARALGDPYLSTYHYARNTPLTLADPTGQIPDWLRNLGQEAKGALPGAWDQVTDTVVAGLETPVTDVPSNMKQAWDAGYARAGAWSALGELSGISEIAGNAVCGYKLERAGAYRDSGYHQGQTTASVALTFIGGGILKKLAGRGKSASPPDAKTGTSKPAAAKGGADVVRHYTTREAAETISKGGSIEPGAASGKIWLTPDRYANGVEARAKLALNKTPDGYFEVPMCRVKCPSAPGRVKPDDGQPGGGIEITTEFPIDIRGLIFRGFE